MDASTLTGRWLRRFGAAGDPRVSLVCLPHAGGAASAYRGWRGRLPADVELLAIRYPGREERLAEPPVESMDEMAGQIAEQLAPLADRGLALFGHSMGAAIAFEVALLLERRGPGPAVLMLSGRGAPGTPEPEVADDDESVLDHIRSLGSGTASAYEDEELRPLLLPSLKADLRLLAGHDPEPGRTLEAPIVVYAGSADNGVSVTEAALWARSTRGRSSLRVFPGGHFYLIDREAELLADISSRL